MVSHARLALVALVLGFLAGCSGPLFGPAGETDSGALTVTPTSIGAGSVFLPGLDMQVATFDIEITGPGASRTASIAAAGAGTTFNALVPGAWTVSVVARNAGGTAVGAGAESVVVSAGVTGSVTVAVRPLDGDGTLAVAIDWPADAVGNPAVELRLDGPAGAVAAPPVTVDPLSGSASATGLLPAGYYTLVVLLSSDATQVWSAVTVVRIVEGETTDVPLPITAGDLATGGAGVVIDPDLDDPFTVTIGGVPTEIERGSTFSATATTDLSPAAAASATFEWFIDADPIGSGPSVVVGSGLSNGTYRLSVVATAGAVLSADEVTFSVIDPVPVSYALSTGMIGSGTVTRSPDRTSYEAGTVVSLSASADAGWIFLGWTDDAGGAINPLPVTMNRFVRVRAVFVQPTAFDSDGDTIPDVDEDVNRNGTVADDNTDGDAAADYLDSDDDGDGVPTVVEADGGVPDTDGDGLPDYLDSDDDGDGFATASEGTVDTDGDGVPDYRDTDDDGDGVATEDEFALDSDGDGVDDRVDPDDDGDGVPTIDEGGPNSDSDGDRTPDYVDPDDDDDGVLTRNERSGDTDADGSPDRIDTDDDGDGIPTLIEGDQTVDSDGDGTPDYLDVDSDDDGRLDLVEDPNGNGVVDPGETDRVVSD